MARSRQCRVHADAGLASAVGTRCAPGCTAPKTQTAAMTPAEPFVRHARHVRDGGGPAEPTVGRRDAALVVAAPTHRDEIVSTETMRRASSPKKTRSCALIGDGPTAASTVIRLSYSLRTLADRPRSWSCSPLQLLQASAADSIPIAYSAKDDGGLSRAWLLLRSAGRPEQEILLHRFGEARVRRRLFWGLIGLPPGAR